MWWYLFVCVSLCRRTDGLIQVGSSRRILSIRQAQSIRAMQLELEALGYDSFGIFERVELERALLEAKSVQRPKKGLRAVAIRGREMARAMDLTEDELRAILVGRRVTDPHAFESKRAMARMLVDLRLADNTLNSDSFNFSPHLQNDKALPHLPNQRRPRMNIADDIDSLLRDAPRTLRIIARDSIVHLDRFADGVAKTADKFMTAASSERTVQTLERHRNTLFSRASSFTKSILERFPYIRSATSIATKTTSSILRRPRLLPLVFESIYAAILTVGDWAAGPHLRREVVFFAFLSALFLKGPLLAFLSLFVFRLLRDFFAKIDSFLADREYYQAAKLKKKNLSSTSSL
mmetsp:Transcript_21792/g.33490  ORF Transcript_21792/g.33490 Transcript_21792/m.33490 type:complete len:349 (-) Transcript_21792:69-1115(-)